MANELFATFQGTATLYAVIRRVSDGKVWSAAAAAWATFADVSVADYDVALASKGGDFYAADFPTAIEAGVEVAIIYYEQAGGSPAITDLVIGRQSGRYAGSAIGSGAGSDLITLARAQAHSQLASVDTSLLGTLITAASKALQTLYKRTWKSTQFTELRDGDGTQIMVLNEFPIISLDTVTITDSDGTEYDIATTNFRINAPAGIIKFKPGASDDFIYFPNSFQNVEIVYTAGYATVPEHVQAACAETVAAMYSSGKTDASLTSERLGDYSYTREAAQGIVPAAAKQLLAAERDVRIGR